MKFPFSLPAQLAWIGPIICRSRAEALPRADARKFLGIPNDATCFYLSLGGVRNPEYQSIEPIKVYAVEVRDGKVFIEV